MTNNIKDLEPGDLAWVAVNENDMAHMGTVVEVTPRQISLRLAHDEMIVADPRALFLLEKWWGHGPLGDGTGMGPDGFDPDWAAKEEKSNDIKDLEE